MKFASLLIWLLVFAGSGSPEPAISYFSNVREVQVAHPDRQSFFIVDTEIWTHSLADLGDLRLYDGETPVQYFISEQRAGVSSEEVDAKVLNLGSVAGYTEFDLDAQGLASYDRVHLRLDAKDFVVTASVAGSNTPGHESSTELTPSTLYDFTSEQLGSSSVLKLPSSSFRYLHVKLSKGILPQQVKGAAIYKLREQQAAWTKVGGCAAPQEKQRTTVIECDLPQRVPVDRIRFDVAPGQVNFRRTVSVDNMSGAQQASGEITRVRVNHAGTLVTSEELAVEVTGGGGRLTLVVDNGDNPPLSIVGAQPLATERRVYFDPQGKTSLKLYYGDEKLSAPVYDYARFFHLDTSPAEAQLAPGVPNPRHTGRPDDRPWSDRHPGILWAAMISAVIVLAWLALRGLRSGAQQ
jgi:hypothetical protein